MFKINKMPCMVKKIFTGINHNEPLTNLYEVNVIIISFTVQISIPDLGILCIFRQKRYQ